MISNGSQIVSPDVDKQDWVTFRDRVRVKCGIQLEGAWDLYDLLSGWDDGMYMLELWKCGREVCPIR